MDKMGERMIAYNIWWKIRQNYNFDLLILKINLKNIEIGVESIGRVGEAELI